MAPEHPANRNKWKAYETLGYDVHNARDEAADDVTRQVNAQLPDTPAERIDDTEWGERHNVHFLIVGPNGQRGTLVTGWHTDAGSDRPRLVTLWLKPHREDT
jgi:hypothetical protein